MTAGAATSLLVVRVVRRVSLALSVVGVVLTAVLPAVEFSIEQHRLNRQQVTAEDMFGVYSGLFGNLNRQQVTAENLFGVYSGLVEYPSQSIPHILVFTYKHNILETKEPALLYNNVMQTCMTYRQLWNDAEPAPIRFLDDEACREAIEQSEPRLVPHFDDEREGKFRADICRIAQLFNHGGYYFDVDLRVIQPIKLDSSITFSSVLSGYPNLDQFFQAFLAATPGHPVLAKALQIMLDYYEGKHAIRGKNVGTSTLKDAYDAVGESERGPSKLLIETKNDIKEKYYYPDVPKLDGIGCCCDQICHDPEEKIAYFYARIPGSSKYCQLNPAAAAAKESRGGTNNKGASSRTSKIAGGSLLGRKNIKIHTVKVGKN